nr:hypothetical protein [Tanacetum cinerariifolium]
MLQAVDFVSLIETCRSVMPLGSNDQFSSGLWSMDLESFMGQKNEDEDEDENDDAKSSENVE